MPRLITEQQEPPAPEERETAAESFASFVEALQAARVARIRDAVLRRHDELLAQRKQKEEQQ